MRSQQQLRAICEKFYIYGDYLVATPFGNGNINDTYQVTYDQGGIRLHYTLQRVNKTVFTEPEKVMENVDRVTRHMLNKIHSSNQATRKRTIRLLYARTGEPYVYDDQGELWRAYIFIEHARTYDVLESTDHAFKAARTFGEFQDDMVDLPGPRLHETIPNFHNTPLRFSKLQEVIKLDPCGRVKEVSEEIDFVMNRSSELGRLVELNQAGLLPERITHNDTKVNNILIDDVSGNGICVLDLDTVMPGLALYDFGDMVRSGTNSAEEDEQRLDRVQMRFDMFEALLRGYLAGAGSFLTPLEREELPFSGKLISMELGMRFLTDYLQGDTYFKTTRAKQNLDRCRTQFKLAKDMEDHFGQMHKLLKSLTGRQRSVF